VPFLIDGYNLMYAAGLATRAMPAAQFDRARARFLDWLADGAGTRDEVRVVFDAQRAPSPSLDTRHRGVRVRFAFRQTADDVIEELVAVERRPEFLVVVSNDSRVREAARRAACVTFTCAEFIDWLITPEPRNPDTAAAPEDDKPIPSVTDEDQHEWLNAFNTPKPKPRR
jgi:predicted RNA-binding protein with PIN domain